MVEFIEAIDEKKGDRKTRIKIKKKTWSFKKILFWFFAIFIIMSFIDSLIYTISPKIDVIPVKNIIGTQESHSLYSSQLSSRKVAEKIYSSADDNSVKAILIDINSGGGTPVASEEISKAIEYAKTKKKVVSLINDIGASGAYFIAVSTNKIYVSPMSIVGSIGVTSAGLSFENFLLEHNITYRRLVSGKYKDIGSPYRDMTFEEKKIINNLLESTHKMFISHIANQRKMSEEEVQKLATGEIFTGREAVKNGLVDEEGYYNDVIGKLKEETGADLVVVKSDSLGIFDSVFSTFSDFNIKSQSLIMFK